LQVRTVAVLALVLGALAAPATAQIIATSIPKSIAGGGEGRWAFHLMYAPYAKWKLNQFEETETSLVSSRAKPNSKFLGAAEAAFTAGSDVTIGLGGWYNKVGSTDYDFLFVESDGTDVFGLDGIRTDNLTYAEGHANVFYKDIGLQVGLVHGKATTTNLAIANFLFNEDVFSRADLVDLLGESGVADIEAGAEGAQIKTNDVDGYLVYKAGSENGDRQGWTFSLGAGAYHYGGSKKTVPSGFATLALGLYKGLGVDASFWYISKSKSDLQKQLGVSDNLSRFSIGIGYTFSSR
jgi:hypothetical protein